jgi:endonuclease YncB( thermonuclease family)
MLLALFFQLALTNTAAAEQFKVVDVIAGDLITVQGQKGRVDIRLMGIDAPENPRHEGETGQPYSREATGFLTELILGKTVDIAHWGKDRYGQAFGVVFLDGQNVNLKMVRSGLAEVYRGRMRKDFDETPYKAVEMEARHRQIGMWSTGHIYISPRVWRQRQR